MAKKTGKHVQQQARRGTQGGLPEQLDRWVFYGFLAIVIALPLAMSRITFDQFDIAKILSLRVLTVLTLAFWIGRMLVTKKAELRWSKLDVVVIGFLALVFISTVTSVHFPTALHGKFKRYEGLLTFVNYGILYFLALQTFTGFERLSSLSRTITLTGGVVALYGAMQYVGLDPLPWSSLPFEERRSFSTFGNPDLLAGFLVIFTPIALAEFLRAKDAKGALLMGASLFFGLMTLLTSFTRGAWLAAAVALVVFVAVAARSAISNPKRLLVVLAAFVGIFVLIAAYSASSGHDVMNLVKRIQSATQITEGSAGTRLEIWKAGAAMIKDDPLLGMGPDTFRIGSERFETLKYAQMGRGKTVADNAHNYVIQLAAGVGIPATLIFLGFFAAVVVIAIRHARKAEGEERLLYAGMIAAVVGYFIHLLFGVSVSGSTGIFWILMSVLVAVAAPLKALEIDLSSAKGLYLKGSMAVLAVVALVSAYFAVTMFAADNHYARAILYSNQNNFSAALASYDRSISLYKNGRYYDGYGMFLEQLGVLQNNPDMLWRAVDIYDKAVRVEPNEADHYISLASAYAKLAQSPQDEVVQSAVWQLDKALTIRPQSISARLLLANVLVYQGKHDDAIEVINYALKIDPQSETAMRLLGKAYEGLGNKEEARKAYERLLTIKPDSQDAKDALAGLGKQ